MAKNATKIIAGVLLAGGVFFLIKYLLPKKDKTPTPPPAPKKEETAPPTGGTSPFPLKKGSKGSLVRSVQTWLLKIDRTSLPKYGADGSFGSETESALQKILGKKTIDSQADIDSLNVIFNKKTFPMMTAPAPSTNVLSGSTGLTEQILFGVKK